MKRKIIRFAAVLAAVLLLGAGGVGLAAERKPVVTAEPLPCFTMGNTVVCFDGGINGDMRCEVVDQDTILCTAVRS